MIDNEHLIDTSIECKQKSFAVLVGVSQKSVSDMISRGVIKKGQNLGQWLLLYCAHLREHAAGRATLNELDLATERAGLAREQKIRIEMQNAITRREYGPIEALELGLSDVMAKVAAQLDTIPGKLKITSDKLTADDLDLVSAVIAKIRNEIASSNIDWFSDKTESDEEIDIDVELDA